jgi:hypothetical protein
MRPAWGQSTVHRRGIDIPVAIVGQGPDQGGTRRYSQTVGGTAARKVELRKSS